MLPRWRAVWGAPLSATPSTPSLLFLQMLRSKKLGETAAAEFKPDLTLVPGHVAAAGQVLTFKGYFKEAVVESGVENHRTRQVVFKYYVENDTCRVLEVKVRAHTRSPSLLSPSLPPPLS